MGAIAESESLLRRVVPDDQGFNPEDPDPKKVTSYHVSLYNIPMKYHELLIELYLKMFLYPFRDTLVYSIFGFGSAVG